MFFIDLEDPDQKWIGLRVINQIFLLGLTVFDRFLFFMDPDPFFLSRKFWCSIFRR